MLALLRKKKLGDAVRLARESGAREHGTRWRNPFAWACRAGDRKTLPELLELGGKLDRRDADGGLPIEAVTDGSPTATAAWQR